MCLKMATSASLMHQILNFQGKGKYLIIFKMLLTGNKHTIFMTHQRTTTVNSILKPTIMSSFALNKDLISLIIKSM